MNIILINHYAGSPKLGMEFRPYYLSCEWVRKGHHVWIIASSFSHLRRVQPVVNQDFEEEVIGGISYLWVQSPKYAGNGIGRVRNILNFVRKVKKNARKLVERIQPDIVIASSTYPMDIYPAHKIAKMYNAKLVYEVHDLWPLSPMELGGYSKNHPFIRIIQKAENYAYKYSDKVVSLLPATLEHMVEHGMKANKFVHIPNGINLEEWKNPIPLARETQSKIDAIRGDNKITVCYTGAHGIANSLRSVIEAMIMLKEETIELILVGDGPEKEMLIGYANEKEATNVHFFPFIDKEQIPLLLAQMDILYIGLKNEPLFRFGISPNKLMDYMMAGKPIVQAINAGNDMVLESNCGISVEPENSVAIAQGIKQLAYLSREERVRLGHNGQNYVLANHDYVVLASKFISELQIK